MWYILNAHNQPVAATQDEYIQWITANGGEKCRMVERHKQDGVLVSTVYLGIDHRLSGIGPPLLWETMIFADDHELLPEDDGLWCRYTSLKEAKLGHKRAVWHVRGKIDHAKSARSA